MTGSEKAAAIAARKASGPPVTMLTAYDYPTARLFDEAGVDALLVGDSLGMVVLGYPDTTHVTLDQMLHHVAAVARAEPRALVIGDFSIGTYPDPATALATARRLVAAGAEAVKLEGGLRQVEKVRAIVEAGIPVCGHLGMLPQRVLEEGVDMAEAERRTLSFLSQWVPANASPMCGNSICQDRRFLHRQMPALERHFHYRNLDVSTLKELARRWAPQVLNAVSKEAAHTALSDVRDSISELRHYRQHMGPLSGL